MTRVRVGAGGLIATGLLVAMVLVGCVPTPPAIQAAPTVEFVVDEDAFHEAILPGFVDSDVASDVEADMLRAGELACEATELGTSRDELIAQADVSMSNAIFNSSMPELLVDSALTYLCDVP